MSVDAIVMLIVAVLVVWGGLALALVNLARHDSPSDLEGGLGRDL